MKLVVTAITLILVSCNGQKKAIMEDKNKDVSGSMPKNQLELVMTEEQGGFETDEILVIRDAKHLKSFFSKINRTRKPGLPLPATDFSNDMLIIQCIGAENHIKTNVLEFLKETPTQMILKIGNNSKTADSSNTIGFSSFSIYKMPQTQKEVIVEKQVK